MADTPRPHLVPEPRGTVVPVAPPSFSVLVAVHDAADLVGDALASALAQTRPALEIVVCDDGSRDALGEALRPFLDDIVLLRREHRGEGAAKNAAARVARGEYVVFLDADDLFLPERLEALGELAAQRPDLDVLTTDAYLEVDGVTVRRCYESTWPFPVDDQRGAILERNFVFGLAAVRRSRMLAVGGFAEDLRWASDWDCWIRMILGGAQVGLVAEPLARYRLRAQGLSSDRPRLLEGRMRVLERALAHPNLTRDDHARVAGALRRATAEARLALAYDAVGRRAAGVRSLALRAAVTPGVAAGSRLRALAAAAAPSLASSRLAPHGDDPWTGAAGVVGRPRPGGGG